MMIEPAPSGSGDGDGKDDDDLLDKFFASLSISDGRDATVNSSNTAAGGNHDDDDDGSGTFSGRMIESTATAATTGSSTGTATTDGVDEHTDEGRDDSKGRMTSSSANAVDKADAGASTNTSTHRRSRRENLAAVARAPEGQKAWREFRRTMDGDDENLDGRVTASSTSTSAAARAPISFALKPSNGNSKKMTKKKKKEKKQGKKIGDDGVSRERPPPQVSAAAERDNTQCHHDHHRQRRRPLWTAVVDTCCLLDDPRGVRHSAFGRLVDMARLARSFHHPDAGAWAWAGAGISPRSSVGVEAEAMDDVEIVIPHVVWTELDGLSKRTESVRRGGTRGAMNDDVAHDGTDWQQQQRRRQAEADELSRLARGATRMLREEMELSSSPSSVAVGFGTEKTIPGVGGGTPVGLGLGRGVVRSETIVDAREAAADFLSGLGDVVNDDRILACVLMEKRRQSSDGPRGGPDKGSNDGGSVAPLPAQPQSPLIDHLKRQRQEHHVPGGVILLTTDQNLACKAMANGAGVYSPGNFHDLFLRRTEARRRLLQREREAGVPSAPAPPRLSRG